MKRTDANFIRLFICTNQDTRHNGENHGHDKKSK